MAVPKYYRAIFRNDDVSFGEMQVYPLAKDYLEHPEKLDGVWVYADSFVKGMIRIDGTQIAELYVDTFFENQGIGGELMRFAVEKMRCDRLWVLEQNEGAIRFYERHGFARTGERMPEAGTDAFLLRMKRLL